MSKLNSPGFTHDQIFAKFSKNARYMGGGCYRINFFNKEIFDTDTHTLFEKYLKCFKKRKGLYYYS